MRIEHNFIRPSKIGVWNSHDFNATYKGKEIRITTDHGFGNPAPGFLFRYDITVIDLKCGGVDVDTYRDFNRIEDAVKFALEGACLLRTRKTL